MESKWRRRSAGVAFSVGAVAVVTGAVYVLRPIAPVVSLGVLYVLAVVAVAVVFGLAYAIPVSVGRCSSSFNRMEGALESRRWIDVDSGCGSRSTGRSRRTKPTR